MALMPDQIDDFVSLTLSKFKRNKWTDLSLEHTQYVSSTLNTKKKVREQGGKDISWRIKVKNTGNARNTGMFDQDQTNVDDVMISASIPWAMQTTNFSYDIREDLFQSGPETFANSKSASMTLCLIWQNSVKRICGRLRRRVQRAGRWVSPSGCRRM